VALVSEEVGWRLSLARLPLLHSVAALFMHYALPQSASPAKEKPLLAPVMHLLGNRALLLATLGGCALFFSFVGVFSFVIYYLQAPPFSLSSALGSLILLLWSLGAVGPVAGAVADRIGWRATLVDALIGSLLALPLSLVGTLPAVVAALAVLTVALFSGATAAQIGVATASESDQGSASATIPAATTLAELSRATYPVLPGSGGGGLESPASLLGYWRRPRPSCCLQESFASFARSFSPDHPRR
jgi:MFS transporter, YNFM family, putative membrane transport protein